MRTAAIFRFGSSAGAAPAAAGAQPVPMPAGPVRFAVAGNAQCEAACADLAPQSIGPDRTLAAALRTRRGDAGRQRARAPCSTPATGSRPASAPADGARYAELLGAEPSLPVFPALGSNDAASGFGAGVFEAAFAGFPAPFGSGAAPAGISTAGIPGAAPDPGARTHYAFDSSGPGGTVRVVVIDNSLGSLAASDPHQNPLEPQLPWLEAVLADARAEGIPAIVMGNRSLNTSFTPKLNVASDGDQVAAGPGRRRRLGLPLRPARREPRDADPGRRRADDPQLRHRHARLPLADLRRRRARSRRLAVRRQRRAAARGGRRRTATRRPTSRRSACG